MLNIIYTMSIFSILFQLIWIYYKSTEDAENKYVTILFYFSVFYTVALFQLVVHTNPELYSKESVSALNLKMLLISPQYLTIAIFVVMVFTEAFFIFNNKKRKKSFYNRKYNVKFIKGFYQNRQDILKRHKRQTDNYNLNISRDLLHKSQYDKYKFLKKLIKYITITVNLIVIAYLLLPIEISLYYLVLFSGFMFVLAIILIDYSKYNLFPEFESIIVCYNFPDDLIKEIITEDNYLKILFKINYKYKLNLLYQADNNYFQHNNLIKEKFGFDMSALSLVVKDTKLTRIGIRIIDNEIKVYFLKQIKNNKTNLGNGIHNNA